MVTYHQLVYYNSFFHNSASVNCPGLTSPTVQLLRGVTCQFFSPVNKQLQLCIPIFRNVIVNNEVLCIAIPMPRNVIDVIFM